MVAASLVWVHTAYLNYSASKLSPYRPTRQITYRIIARYDRQNSSSLISQLSATVLMQRSVNMQGRMPQIPAVSAFYRTEKTESGLQLFLGSPGSICLFESVNRLATMTTLFVAFGVGVEHLKTELVRIVYPVSPRLLIWPCWCFLHLLRPQS